jgi:hypothetical protein
MGVIITASVFGLVCVITAWGASKADELKTYTLRVKDASKLN